MIGLPGRYTGRERSVATEVHEKPHNAGQQVHIRISIEQMEKASYGQARSTGTGLVSMGAGRQAAVYASCRV